MAAAKEQTAKTSSTKKAGKKSAAALESETELVDTDGKGNVTLPGMEYKVVKPLVNQVKKIENELKPAFSIARDALVRGKGDLAGLCHKYLDHFVRNEKDELVYQAGGIKITISGKETITTDYTEDDVDV